MLISHIFIFVDYGAEANSLQRYEQIIVPRYRTRRAFALSMFHPAFLPYYHDDPFV